MTESKFKYVFSKPTKEELNKYNCYKLVRRNRMTEAYRILSEPNKTSEEEWIKVCGGVFGGRVEGDMVYAYID